MTRFLLLGGSQNLGVLVTPTGTVPAVFLPAPLQHERSRFTKRNHPFHKQGLNQ